MTVTEPDVIITDARPSAALRPARRPAVDWLMFSVACAAFVLVMPLWLNRTAPAPAAPGVVGTTAEIMVTFDQTRPNSAVAKFADGTQRDIRTDAFERIWQPDRPVIMITVAGVGACSIQVGLDVWTDYTRSGSETDLCQVVWLAGRPL